MYRAISLVCLVVGLANGVTVCENFWDYNWSMFSSRCRDSPILDLNITEIIRTWGFKAEEHYITTEDGYKILLERAYAKITRRTPIIIVHGIAMTALNWVNREEKSLAYQLGILGYDVWMLNYRGTYFSKRHVDLDPSNPEFWKFNVNDMGIYDVRSTVKYVYDQTGQQAIYIGYSMGTTGFFIYSTTFPNEAEIYLKGMIALAPVINYKGIKSMLTLTHTMWPSFKPAIYTLWHGEILPGYSRLLKPFLSFTAGIYTMQYFFNQIFGDDYDQMDPLYYPLFALQSIDTAGAEVYSHFLQIYESGVFQNYDHGKEKNLEVYGTETPPAYDLSKIPVPVALLVGANDWLATETNAKQLYSELKPTSRCGYYVIQFDKWNHVDFLMAKDVLYYLYVPLFDKIEQIDSGKCEF